jgi:hypothetical protein
MNLIDYAGNVIRLTEERLAHTKEHPEMIMHTAKIDETLASPDIVIKSRTDEEARLYFRSYLSKINFRKTPIFFYTPHPFGTPLFLEGISLRFPLYQEGIKGCVYKGDLILEVQNSLPENLIL